MTTQQPTFYFHDYESWGANPKKDHPCQFAGIRTDHELNIIGKPLTLFSQIPNDYLPQPEACLITGITPQQSLRDGLIEAEFIARIHQQFSQPNTCAVGYNSIRFDDEMTRYTLYRNFYDPYAREWQNGNSRWDIIDMVRACYALRPEGVEWVFKQDGSPSFKLEDLTQANGIDHGNAHDATSDVYAAIGLAKRIKQAQPKLFDFLFSLRKKQEVSKYIDCFNMTPFVHISSKLPAIQGCCTWMVPVIFHPTNKNAVICINLATDPEALLELSAEDIREKLYTPTTMLEEGEERIPLKLVHINKCPVVAPAKTLSEAAAERLGIDREACLKHLKVLKGHPGLAQKLSQVFEQEESFPDAPADQALYSGGFPSASDKALMERLRQVDMRQLADPDWQFDDAKYNKLLFMYRGRNYPQSLTHDEAQKWQQHRQFRLTDADSPASIILPDYLNKLENLSLEHQSNPRKLSILKDLYLYAQSL